MFYEWQQGVLVCSICSVLYYQFFNNSFYRQTQSSRRCILAHAHAFYFKRNHPAASVFKFDSWRAFVSFGCFRWLRTASWETIPCCFWWTKTCFHTTQIVSLLCVLLLSPIYFCKMKAKEWHHVELDILLWTNPSFDLFAEIDLPLHESLQALLKVDILLSNIKDSISLAMTTTVGLKLQPSHYLFLPQKYLHCYLYFVCILYIFFTPYTLLHFLLLRWASEIILVQKKSPYISRGWHILTKLAARLFSQERKWQKPINPKKEAAKAETNCKHVKTCRQFQKFRTWATETATMWWNTGQGTAKDAWMSLAPTFETVVFKFPTPLDLLTFWTSLRKENHLHLMNVVQLACRLFRLVKEFDTVTDTDESCWMTTFLAMKH